MEARLHRRRSGWGVAVAAILPASAAFAADPPEPAAPDAEKIQEVVVTAQRRAENLKSVPISVQVVGGQAIGQQNQNSLQDLTQVMPDVHVSFNAANTDMYIRGIGSGNQQTFEQSVGLFIDDVYHGRSHVSQNTFLDVDRIEVLKGPQSTFFGNNAIAGALNVVTNKPGDAFDASARALYGEDGQYAVEGAVGGPITDRLGIRVAGIADGGTGWLTNTTSGKTVPGEDNLAGRVTVVYKPTDDLDATLKLEANKNREYGDVPLQFVDCPPPPPFSAGAFCQTALNLGVPIYPIHNLGDKIDESPGQGYRIGAVESALTINEHLWDQTFTSVTGFYAYHFDQNLDLDATPANLATTAAPERYNQVSQELRVASPTDQPIEYLAGFYYQSDHLVYNQSVDFPFLTPVFASIPPFAPLVPYLPIAQSFNYDQPERDYSVFGSATWNVTDELKLSAGLRGSWVEKSFVRDFYYGTAHSDYGSVSPLPPSVAQYPVAVFGIPVGTLTGSRDDHDWMPSAKIQYQAAPEAMLYFTYSKGFKAGGFNGSDTTGILSNMFYQPETVNAYEAGIKSKWLDDKLLLNLDVFRGDYTNLQVNVEEGYTQGNGVAVVRNAAASQSQGVEFEGQWAVSRGFRLSANITLLDSHYVSYPNAGPTALDQFYHIPVQDLSGHPTEYAPSWSGSITGTYTTTLPGDYVLTAEISPFFSTSYYLLATEDGPTKQGSYVRLDGRLTFETPDGRWALDLIGKNLTDTNILTFATIAPTSLGSFFAAREEGVNFAGQVRFKW